MRQKLILSTFIALSLSFVAAGCNNGANNTASNNTPSVTTNTNSQQTTMTISSPAFVADASIPSQFTCDGANISPALNFSGVPADAKSLALIMDDPDAPNGTFVHWVVANINPATTTIAERDSLSNAMQGLNGANKVGYTGPCPPSGTHHYHFKLFALDTMLNVTQPDAATLQQAMQGHIIDQAELVAVYQRTQ